MLAYATRYMPLVTEICVQNFKFKLIAPTAVLNRNATLGAAGDEMERCVCALATQIPERDVHGHEGEAYCRAHRVGVGV